MTLTHFTKEDGEKTFYYLSEESDLGKLTSLSTEKFETITHVDQLKDIKPKRFNKVLRYPVNDAFAKNNYPTVFGVVTFKYGDKKNEPEIKKEIDKLTKD